MAGRPKRNSEPLGDDPGFILARTCAALPGHLILVDLKKTKLEVETEGSDQWLVIHHPSFHAATFKTRRAARQEVEVGSTIGNEWTQGIAAAENYATPKPPPAKKKRPAPAKKAAPKKKQSKDPKPPPAKKAPAKKKRTSPKAKGEKENDSRAPARETKTGKKRNATNQAALEAQAKKEEIEAVIDGRFEIEDEAILDPNYLNNDLIAGLDRDFSNARINELIEEMWTSQRPIVIKGKRRKEWDPLAGPEDQNGKNKGAWVEKTDPDTIEWVANWSAREKALELVIKYKIGNPLQRLEVKSSSDLTMEELEEFARESPAFAQALEGVLRRAKGQAP